MTTYKMNFIKTKCCDADVLFLEYDTNPSPHIHYCCDKCKKAYVEDFKRVVSNM